MSEIYDEEIYKYFEDNLITTKAYKEYSSKKGKVYENLLFLLAKASLLSYYDDSDKYNFQPNLHILYNEINLMRKLVQNGLKTYFSEESLTYEIAKIFKFSFEKTENINGSQVSKANDYLEADFQFQSNSNNKSFFTSDYINRCNPMPIFTDESLISVFKSFIFAEIKTSLDNEFIRKFINRLPKVLHYLSLIKQLHPEFKVVFMLVYNSHKIESFEEFFNNFICKYHILLF